MKLISMLFRPDHPYHPLTVLDGQRELDRHQLQWATLRCIETLRASGIRPGDRVLALPGQDVRGLLLLAAASGLGVRLSMPYNLSAAAVPEWHALATTARPDHVVSFGHSAEVVETLRGRGVPVLDLDQVADLFDPRADEPDAVFAEPVEDFLVLFTSGSTGSPKGVCVSEELICRRIASVTEALSFDPAARIFMSGLINNTTGVIFSFGALLHSSTLCYPTGRAIEQWPAQVAQRQATHIMLRPVALRRFLDGAGETDLSSLQVVAYGAAAMPRTLLEQGRRRMPCQWVQGYGLSETYGPFCWLDEQGHAERRYLRGVYCVGRPDSTVQLRLEPVAGHPAPAGEILLRSDAIMQGYYDPVSDLVHPLPEWFRTGDIAEWTEDGDLLLKGRIQGSLLSENGHRIYPEEVEAALAAGPGIDEVVLVGVPYGDEGAERPVACVRGPITGYDVSTMRKLLRETLTGVLSEEKWPDRVCAFDGPFPIGINDKLQRAQIAAAAAAGSPFALTEEETDSP